MEKGQLRRLSDEDVQALPVLYRTVASSLSVAREISLDAATLAYLEALVQRAWFVVYGPRSSLGSWLRSFLGGGWSASVRAMWLDVLIALAVMVAGAAAGWLLVAGDPDWYGALVPGGLADTRVPGASREVLLGSLTATQDSTGLAVFAAYLFSNNAQVSILRFRAGLCLRRPDTDAAGAEHRRAGRDAVAVQRAGPAARVLGWLSVHGTTELFAILLAGASGLHVGRSMAFPGQLGVLEAAGVAGRRAAQVMSGVVLMLVVAAILEGFARQLVPDTARAAYHRPVHAGAVAGLFLAAGARPARGRQMSAPPAKRLRGSGRERVLITPEGIVLPIVLASKGARAGALLMDLAFVTLLQIMTTIMLASIAFGGLSQIFEAGDERQRAWRARIPVRDLWSSRCSCSATPGSCSSNWDRAAPPRASGSRASASPRAMAGGFRSRW